MNERTIRRVDDTDSLRTWHAKVLNAAELLIDALAIPVIEKLVRVALSLTHGLRIS